MEELNAEIKKDENVISGSSHMLNLLDEFSKIYSDRLNRVEENSSKCNETQYLQNKVGVLESWVHDLGEQNQVLVATVEELEREAAERVALLQQKLSKMAANTRESCISLRDHHSQVASVMSEKVDLEKETARLRDEFCNLERSMTCLKEENNNLNQDLNTIVQVVNHARMTGKWDSENCVFNCISPDQIFGSSLMSSRPSMSTTPKDVRDDYLDKYDSEENDELSRKDSNSLHSSLCGLDDYSGKYSNRDSYISKLKSELESVRHLLQDTNEVLSQRNSDIAELQVQMTNLHQELTLSQSESDEKSQELLELRDKYRHLCADVDHNDDGSVYVTSTSNSLKKKYFQEMNQDSSDEEILKSNSTMETQLNENIDGLLCRLSDLEKDCEQLRDKYSNLEQTHNHCSTTIHTLQDQLDKSRQSHEDLREVLTAEVAERHDQVLNLRNQVKEGEIKLHETNMQVQLKAEVIKDLRKELKDMKMHGNNPLSNTHHKKDQEVMTDHNLLGYSDTYSRQAELSLQILKNQNELTEKNILIRELQGHLATSRQELHLKDETLNKVENKLDNSRREGEYREDRVQYLTSQLTNLQLEIARIHGHSEQLQRQIDTKNDLIQKLENENNSLSHQLNDKSSRIERLQTEISSVTSDVDKFKKQISEQKSTIGTLQDALIATKQVCDKLRLGSNSDLTGEKDVSIRTMIEFEEAEIIHQQTFSRVG